MADRSESEDEADEMMEDVGEGDGAVAEASPECSDIGAPDESSSESEQNTETDNEYESQFMLDEKTFVAAKSSRNLRSRIYSDLIQGGQDFEDRDGIDGFDLQKVLTENTIKGHQLGTIHAKCTTDMHNAILHSNMCTRMLRYQSEKIGDTRVFRIDQYIQGIKGYGEKAGRRLAKLFAASAAPSPVSCLIGSFGREDILPVPKKVKKVPGPRRKRVFDETMSQATQHEEVTQGSGKSQEKKPTNHAELVSSNMLKMLKRKAKERPKPFNYFEFTLNNETLGETIQNMFYMGFLVRDGHASLTRDDSHGGGKGNMIIKPEKPPVKKQSSSDAIPRNQHIVSFSPRIYREMVQAAQGNTEIPPCELQKVTTAD